jgi:hypothetical protein
MGRTTFRDLLMIMLLGFVFMIVAMIPHLNPPATEDDAEPPGNVIAHITWPKGNIDVDMWVMGPGEIVPVGYSNKGGLLWNLLRDDLGGNDATDLNYENAYTRGIIPGEYIINVHCYRCYTFPVPVTVEVSVKRESDGNTKTPLRVIATTLVELHSNGEEATALRFTLDREGNLEPGSMNHVFRPLRAMKKSSAGDHHPGGMRMKSAWEVN